MGKQTGQAAATSSAQPTNRFDLEAVNFYGRVGSLSVGFILSILGIVDVVSDAFPSPEATVFTIAAGFIVFGATGRMPANEPK